VRFPTPGELEGLIPTRETLLGRLRAAGEGMAWQEPFAVYWRLIYRLGLRAGCGEVEAVEVVVGTVLSLSNHRAGFAAPRPKVFLKEWVNMATQESEAIRLCRGSLKESKEETASEPPVLARGVWEEEWERNLLELALERVKSEVKPAQYQVFDLVVLRKWPLARVGAALDVNIGQIYLARLRLIRSFKRELRCLAKRYG